MHETEGEKTDAGLHGASYRLEDKQCLRNASSKMRTDASIAVDQEGPDPAQEY